MIPSFNNNSLSPPFSQNLTKDQEKFQSKINSDQTKLAWLAGLYQGEGYFHERKRYIPAVLEQIPTVPVPYFVPVPVKGKERNEGKGEYIPAPNTPVVKLEMIEKDLMNHIGNILEVKVVEVKRKTTAGKTVYKVTLEARKKTEIFLRAIFPYIVGEKTHNKIKHLLDLCDQHTKWISSGSRNKVAKISNQASQKANKNNIKE